MKHIVKPGVRINDAVHLYTPLDAPSKVTQEILKKKFKPEKRNAFLPEVTGAFDWFALCLIYF